MYTKELAKELVLRWSNIRAANLDKFESESAKEKMSVLLNSVVEDLNTLKEKYPQDPNVILWQTIAVPIVRFVFGRYVELDTFHVTSLPISLIPFPETAESKPIICTSKRLKSRAQFTDQTTTLSELVKIQEQFANDLISELDTLLDKPVVFYKLKMKYELPEEGMLSNVTDWYIQYAEI